MLAKLQSLGLTKVVLAGLVLALLVGGGATVHSLRSKHKLAVAPSPSLVPTSPPVVTPLPSPEPTPSTAPATSPAAKAKTSPVAEPKPAEAKSSEPAPSPSPTPDDKPKVQHIGVNLGYFDAASGKAGDFRFTKAKLHNDRVWMDYGYLITQTNTGSPKRNVQPTFILPMGTKVHSLVDGKVTALNTLYSGDYGIMVQRVDNDKYTYETEHVTNPLVKVGDTVTAGQVIAEVSPHDSKYNEGMGLVEIGILTTIDGRPHHLCPFAYLDPAIKSDIQAKITALYKSWEEYRGADYYDDGAYPMPGCQLLDPLPD